MKKYFVYLISLLFFQSINSQENPTLINIPHEVFVNGGTDNFDQILFSDQSLMEKVKILHTYNELAHELTVESNNFEQYWSRYAKQWSYIQFRKSTPPLLLFKGLIGDKDEREFVEIFDVEKDRNERLLFSEVGNLLAYKEHPFTEEIILFVHKYPCCKSASHNIYKIRQLSEGLQYTDRFFVGRDIGDMVGPFFPKEVIHDGKYHYLTQRTELRWSPAVVSKNAFEGWTESNLIIHYNEGAMYRILHDQGEWLFVLFYNGIAEEQSMMLNYTNFRNKGVYGWIKK